MTTDSELVDIAYRGLLNRPAEPAAIERWVARFAKEPKTRLFAYLVASPEFARRYQHHLEEKQRESEKAVHAARALQQQFLGLLQFLSPKRATAIAKTRVGRAGDGGYVMLDDLAGVETAFSCGIGAEFTWDSQLADRGVRVHQIDHSVEAPPRPDGKFSFHRLRLDAAPGDGAITLHEIAAMAGSARSILKVDVEGAEWPAFAAVEPADLLPFSQILVEFHDLSKAVEPDRMATYNAALRKIHDGFQCVHVHANNFRMTHIIAGIPVPDVLEVTFASRRNYVFAETDETFPTPLDAPNNPLAPDFMLGSFRFS